MFFCVFFYMGMDKTMDMDMGRSWLGHLAAVGCYLGEGAAVEGDLPHQAAGEAPHLGVVSQGC